MVFDNGEVVENSGKAVHVLISGRVQRVWFRGWVEQEATRLGLQGWVCNLSDGRVEAVFSGDADDVDEMIDLCWQGPRRAEVEGVMITPANVPAESGFRVKRGH